jgi:hypothetical protein
VALGCHENQYADQCNKYMGDLDHFDHYYLTYPFASKMAKWYHLIWHSVVEVTFVYECIAYNIEIPEKKKRKLATGNSKKL